MTAWIYDSVKAIVWVFFHLVTSWQVNEKHNIPRQGKLIIVANHFSLADPLLIGASVSRRANFIAKEELFSNWLLRCLLYRLGAIPVRRGKIATEVLRAADKVLKQDRVLALFPEGARSRNGQLGPAFSGAALIAMRSGAPVLPIGVSGTEKVQGFAWLLRRPQVSVNIGSAFYLDEPETGITGKELTGATGLIMEHIAGLLPAGRRGNYGVKPGS